MSQVFTKYTDTAKMQEMLDQSQGEGQLIVFKDLNDIFWQIACRPDLQLNDEDLETGDIAENSLGEEAEEDQLDFEGSNHSVRVDQLGEEVETTEVDESAEEEMEEETEREQTSVKDRGSPELSS